MDLQRPKCDFNDFPEAPDWAVCVIDNGVHSAFCEEFDYMARAQWLGGREFRVSNPTAFTVIASRNESGKPEWDGVGLPPVGCECEFNAYGRGWEKCVVLYVSEYTLLLRTDRASDPEEAFIPGDIEFRPIRSEAEKKRYEVETELRTCLAGTGAGITRLAAKCIYDAIAAGKIPHIRID